MQWQDFGKIEPSPITKQILSHSNGFIQWKNTNVCMDFYCECGFQGHIDDDFVYYIECPDCHTVYEVGSRVEMVPVDRKDAGTIRSHWSEDV
jgi:hypothetical protein